jgi:hypothetical protein
LLVAVARPWGAGLTHNAGTHVKGTVLVISIERGPNGTLNLRERSRITGHVSGRYRVRGFIHREAGGMDILCVCGCGM